MDPDGKLSSYEMGMIYEDFMRKAFKTEDNTKHGIHCSVMQNLIDVENNASSFVGSLGSPIEQLEQVKRHLNRAFDEILKRRMSSDIREDFELKQSIIEFAESSEDLMAIVNNGLNILIQTKV